MPLGPLQVCGVYDYRHIVLYPYFLMSVFYCSARRVSGLFGRRVCCQSHPSQSQRSWGRDFIVCFWSSGSRHNNNSLMLLLPIIFNSSQISRYAIMFLWKLISELLKMAKTCSQITLSSNYWRNCSLINIKNIFIHETQYLQNSSWHIFLLVFSWVGWVCATDVITGQGAWLLLVLRPRGGATSVFTQLLKIPDTSHYLNNIPQNYVFNYPNVILNHDFLFVLWNTKGNVLVKVHVVLFHTRSEQETNSIHRYNKFISGHL